jgi:hypothetical protein
VSQITFYSDVPLLSVNQVLSSIAERLTTEVSANLKLSSPFQPQAISLGLDPEMQRIAVHPFSIERREGTPFSERKYFSAAPVSTDTHISLVEAFEKAVRV